MWKILLIIIILTNSVYSNNEASEKLGVIITEKVNLRLEPTVSSKVIYQFTKRDIVFCIQKSENKYKINNEEYFWYKIKTQYNNEKKFTGWVYGKYIKIFDESVNDDDIVLKKIIFGRYDNYYSIMYNPTLKVIKLNNRNYYILTFYGEDDPERGMKNFGHSEVYIYRNKADKYVYLRGVADNDAPFHFYDLDNDGLAEIFIYRTAKEDKSYGITIYSEKHRKDIFHYVIPDIYWIKIKRNKDTWVELKEIEPNRKCEIIVHLRESDKKSIKNIYFVWDKEKGNFVVDANRTTASNEDIVDGNQIK